AAVDEALVVQVLESGAHGTDGPRVQREHLAGPVTGGAEPAVLVVDDVAVLTDPVPHALQKGLAANLVTVQPLLSQGALYDHLRRDAGVVGPRQVEGAVAHHAVVARQRVLD